MEGNSESNSVKCNSDSNSNSNGGDFNSIPILLELELELARKKIKIKFQSGIDPSSALLCNFNGLWNNMRVFRCKTHYSHLVHSEKFNVLRITLNACCHKSDTSARHSMVLSCSFFDLICLLTSYTLAAEMFTCTHIAPSIVIVDF